MLQKVVLKQGFHEAKRFCAKTTRLDIAAFDDFPLRMNGILSFKFNVSFRLRFIFKFETKLVF